MYKLTPYRILIVFSSLLAFICVATNIGAQSSILKSIDDPSQVFVDETGFSDSPMQPLIAAPDSISILSQTSNSITIIWPPVDDPRLHSYNLRLNGEYHGWQPPDTTSYTFENLQPNTYYELSVLSVEIPALVYSSATTIGVTTPFSLIAAPESIWVQTSTIDSITVGWTAVDDPRLHSYNLRLNGQYHGWTPPGITTYTFTDLLAGVEYNLGVLSVEIPAEVYSSETTVVATPVAPTTCASPETFRTAIVDGTPHAFVNGDGSAQRLNGVNIRTSIEIPGNVRYSLAEFQEISAKGFDSIRVTLNWPEFEPTQSNFSEAMFVALDTVIQRAADAGLWVILDPIHIKGGEAIHLRNIPNWAWAGQNSDHRMMEVLRNHALPYLRKMTERYCDNATVVAIDLLNEPREDNVGWLFDRNQRLVDLYRFFIEDLRAIDPNKAFLIEPFYGSARFDIGGNTLMALSDLNEVILSIHDYYAGEGVPSNGYSTGGYGNVQPRVETWNSTGIYPSGNRATARNDIGAHIAVHRDAASAAGIPLHVGEYGVPVGWSGRWEIYCDKTKVYRGLGVPVTAWVWNQDIDYGFGLWNPGTGWNSWSDAIFDAPQCH